MKSHPTLAIGAILALALAACSSDEAAPIPSDRAGSVSTTSSRPTSSTVVPETSSAPEMSAVAPKTDAPAPTPTSEPAAVQPSAVWSATPTGADLLNESDPEQELNVMVLPDGRPRVVYGTGTSLRMATCVDVACTEAETVEVLDTAPALAGSSWLSAALRGDGSPVIITSGYDPAAATSGSEWLVVWCEDPGCASVTTSVLREAPYAQPQLVASPDGRVGVFDVVSTEPAVGGPPPRFVGFTYCDDVGCLDEPDELVELWSMSIDEYTFVTAAGGFDSNGLPLVAYSPNLWSGEAELMVVACRDVDCVSVDEPVSVADDASDGYWLRSPIATAGGGLTLLYQRTVRGINDILVTVCEQIACSNSVSAELFHLEQAGVPRFSGALGSDGSLRVVWTTSEGLVLATCDDPTCSAFVTSELLPLGWQWTHQIGMVVAGDGATVVAVADFGAPTETNVLPGVWFFRCEDRHCVPGE